jgi:hypothetical protein
MIGKIEQSGRYVAVTGSAGSSYVNNTGLMSVGQLQFNTHSQQLEVYNGISWQVLNLGTYYVGLNPHAEQILDWACKKMEEEQGLSTLPSDHPAVKAAKQNLNKAKLEVKRLEEQLKVTEILIHEESTS